MSRPDSRNKTLVERIRRWIRRKRRDRAIRAEEKKIAAHLAAKARAREIRELQKTEPNVQEPGIAPIPILRPKEPGATPQVDRTVPDAAPPIPMPGLFAHWRRYRELRAAQIQLDRQARRARSSESSEKRKKSSSLDVGSTDQSASVVVKRKKASSFGVGSSDQSASDVKITLRRHPIRRLRRAYRRSVRRRIPQWLLAMSPALFFGLGLVLPAMTESSGNASANLAQYRDAWAEAVRGKRWKDAELFGLRVISNPSPPTRDLFDYFDTLVADGQLQSAVRLLIAAEHDQRDLAIADYRFDIAERFLTRLEGSSELVELALAKLSESLRGPLAKDKEIRARKVLSSAFAVRGDLGSALAILQPIRENDLVTQCDCLWLSWNIAPFRRNESFDQEVAEALKRIEERMVGQSILEGQEIAARARLSSLSNQDAQFLEWVEKDARIDAAGKEVWKREIENLGLVRVLRTEPLNPVAAWDRLSPILEREPDNQEMIDMAIGLAIAAPDRTSQGARDWLMRKVRDKSTDSRLLSRASIAAHSSAQWALAAECYERLVALDPNDSAALNNLAGLYYKTLPYRFDEALKLIDQALVLAPDHLAFLETKGQILARLGRVDEARALLERCLASFPEEWNLHNTLAQIYEQQGRRDLSTVHREKLLGLKKPVNAPVDDRIVFPKANTNAAAESGDRTSR